ncbi:GNAT family N-acetyltransferase [Stutzerimonas nitrititolerans]|uniref:GNAT family N-acetyltransferase n=1 Tax=Stutzerimonas nitrititolerans TaxID=2482751 RepID=UPI0028B1A8B2|nr:GNAT family N-acetyltransferase [Stutzerimonas nitrititolerans]
MDDSLFTVRNATADDIVWLIELRALLLDGTSASYSSRSPEDSARWRTAYKQWLRAHLGVHDGVQVLAAEHRASGQVVACATGIIDLRAPTFANPNGLCGWVQSMVVAPHWRTHGIAMRLMDGLLRWFGNRDVATVVLQTTEDASRLYERLGFRPTDECLLIRQEVSV